MSTGSRQIQTHWWGQHLPGMQQPAQLLFHASMVEQDCCDDRNVIAGGSHKRWQGQGHREVKLAARNRQTTRSPLILILDNFWQQDFQMDTSCLLPNLVPMRSMLSQLSKCHTGSRSFAMADAAAASTEVAEAQLNTCSSVQYGSSHITSGALSARRSARHSHQ